MLVSVGVSICIPYFANKDVQCMWSLKAMIRLPIFYCIASLKDTLQTLHSEISCTIQVNKYRNKTVVAMPSLNEST